MRDWRTPREFQLVSVSQRVGRFRERRQVVYELVESMPRNHHANRLIRKLNGKSMLILHCGPATSTASPHHVFLGKLLPNFSERARIRMALAEVLGDLVQQIGRFRSVEWDLLAEVKLAIRKFFIDSDLSVDAGD